MNNWEVCPSCYGSGIKQLPYIHSGILQCEVCNGKKIINSFTGYPPVDLYTYQTKKEWDDFINLCMENLPKDNESGYYGYLEIQSAIMSALKESSKLNLTP